MIRSAITNVRRLIPAACAAALLATCAAPATAQYATQVARWTAQDAADPVVSGGIVFAGSSSIRRWEELTLDFNDYNVLQRGLGGATFDSYQAHVNDAVVAHSPRAVVVWLGTNDIAGGVSGASVASKFTTFVNSIHAPLPDTDIFYIGIVPTPGRQGNRAQEDIANSQIANYAASTAHVHYIDLPATYIALGDGLGQDPYGDPNFVNKYVDSIHQNRSGYNIWETEIRNAIETQVGILPDKAAFAASPSTPQPGERILFDFGPTDGTQGDATITPDVNGNHWNNWWVTTNGGTDILPGEHVGNLVTTSGRTTGVDLTITAQFESNGKNNGGLGAPNPALLGDLAIRTATIDYFFSTGNNINDGTDDDDGGGFMLSGLDPAFTYDFKLFGSRNSTETRITEYKITGAQEHLTILQTSGADIGVGPNTNANGGQSNNSGTYDGNDDAVAEILGVRPDQFGQVFFDQTLLSGSFAYISAMEITVNNVPEPGAATLGATIGLISLMRERRPRN